MSASTNLLRLIASMTKQEKRYFKLYAAFYNKDKGNVCLQVFDIIDKEKPQSDQELQAIVHKKPYKARLSVIKNQLAELLLDSLAAFHAAKQSSFQIRRLLTHAEVLKNKGLYEYSEKLITRAEKKARDTHHNEFLVEIAASKRSALVRQVPDEFERRVEQLYEQADKDIFIIQHTNHYLKLMDIMQVLAARYAAHPLPGDQEKLKSIAEHPLLHNAEAANGFQAQSARYNTLGTYYLLTGNIEKARDIYRQTVQLWKNLPAMVAERPSRYKRFLLNYLNCMLDSPDEEEFMSIVRDLKNLPSSFSEPENTTRVTIWNLELLYHLNHGSMDKAAAVVNEVENNLAQYAPQFSRVALTTLYYNCTVFYFLSGNYRRTIDQLNLLLNEPKIKLKRDLQEFIHVLSIVTHYELRNFDILDNMIRSTKRFLKQHETQGALEHIVLRAIRALLGAATKQAALTIFHSLYTKLAEQLHNTTTQEPPGLPELLFWTKSKILGASMSKTFTETMQSASGQSYRAMFPLDASTPVQRRKQPNKST